MVTVASAVMAGVEALAGVDSVMVDFTEPVMVTEVTMAEVTVAVITEVIMADMETVDLIQVEIPMLQEGSGMATEPPRFLFHQEVQEAISLPAHLSTAVAGLMPIRFSH